MDAELYLKKAILQLSRGMEEKGVQSLKLAIDSDDEISHIQASVILGEYFVMKGKFACAKEILEQVSQESSELEQKYDDLLNDEIYRADMLLDMIKRFEFLLN